MAKTSRLERLFRYAKASRAEALENFVTEALASAIEEDGGPLLAALGAMGIQRGPVTDVETQVGAAGCRIFDLRVTFEGGGPVVVEVKVWSPPDPVQLAKYMPWCAQHQGDLVLLAPTSGGFDRWLSWQRLFAAAKGAEHPYWRDLCAYLEELGLANDVEHPVSPTDAVVLAGGPALVKRASATIRPVLGVLEEVWPSTTALAGPDLERQLLRRWADGEGLTYEVRVDARLGLALGLRAEGGRLECAVWIWAKPFTVQGKLLAAARELPAASWTVSQDPGAWIPIEAKVDGAGMSPAEMSSWLRLRVAELEAAKLLAGLGAKGADESMP